VPLDATQRTSHQHCKHLQLPPSQAMITIFPIPHQQQARSDSSDQSIDQILQEIRTLERIANRLNDLYSLRDKLIRRGSRRLWYQWTLLLTTVAIFLVNCIFSLVDLYMKTSNFQLAMRRWVLPIGLISSHDTVTDNHFHSFTLSCSLSLRSVPFTLFTSLLPAFLIY